MMAACAEQELMLNGMLDGELDAANTARLESHLATCRDCRDELARLQSVRQAVTGRGVRHEAPGELKTRVLASLAEAPPAGARSAYRLPSWLAPGAAGALAASLAMLLVLPAGEQSQLDTELIAGHIRSLQVEHLTDVRTSNEHLVRPWFNGKIDFAPPVPELAGDGFPLAGGRLDYLNGRTVAAIVYKRRLHTINLFVWPAPASGDKRIEKDGYTMSEWSQGGLRYAAVSDLAPAELEQFRQVFVRSTKG